MKTIKTPIDIPIASMYTCMFIRHQRIIKITIENPEQQKCVPDTIFRLNKYKKPSSCSQTVQL